MQFPSVLSCYYFFLWNTKIRRQKKEKVGSEEETFPHVWWFIYGLGFFRRMPLVMSNIIQYYARDNTTWHNFQKEIIFVSIADAVMSSVYLVNKKTEQPSKGMFVRQTTAEIQYNYYVPWNWSSNRKNMLTVVWFAESVG